MLAHCQFVPLRGAALQVIDDAAGRTLVAASTLTADVKGSVEGNGANIVSSSKTSLTTQRQQ